MRKKPSLVLPLAPGEMSFVPLARQVEIIESPLTPPFRSYQNVLYLYPQSVAHMTSRNIAVKVRYCRSTEESKSKFVAL